MAKGKSDLVDNTWVVLWNGGYRRCDSKREAAELAMDLAEQGKKNVRIQEVK